MKNRILTLGDLHFGIQNKIPTQVLCDRVLNRIFPYISKADLLTINGDIFHSDMSMTNASSKALLSFFIQLMAECEKYNTCVRIIRGTVSHDRTQSEHIPILHKSYGYKFDLKYFDTLMIEYIEALDLKVIYVPDDLPYNSSEEVMSRIKEMLHQAGWKKVDLILVHGYFQHMLPRGVRTLPKTVYRESQMSKILSPKGYVLANHVHTKSIYNKVIGVGSFDRLAHNEEETKGCFYIDDEVTFIENKDATPYLTCDLSKYTDKDICMEKYKKFLETRFVKDVVGYSRVIHGDITVRQILQKMTTEYPYLVYSHKASKVDKDTVTHTDDLEIDSELEVVITKENLPNIASNYINNNDATQLLSVEEITSLLELNAT